MTPPRTFASMVAHDGGDEMTHEDIISSVWADQISRFGSIILIQYNGVCATVWPDEGDDSMWNVAARHVDSDRPGWRESTVYDTDSVSQFIHGVWDEHEYDQGRGPNDGALLNPRYT